jgi:hypothetical protein
MINYKIKIINYILRRDMSSKNETTRITIDVPLDDHERLIAFATREGKSVQEVINELLKDRLAFSENVNLKTAVEEVLKKYAPALDKLSKS